jgi:hypothetical protein
MTRRKLRGRKENIEKVDTKLSQRISTTFMSGDEKLNSTTRKHNWVKRSKFKYFCLRVNAQ